MDKDETDMRSRQVRDPSMIGRPGRHPHGRALLRTVFIILCVLNGLLSLRFWPRPRSGYLNGCVTLRSLFEHELRVCGPSLGTAAVRAPDARPPGWLSDP